MDNIFDMAVGYFAYFLNALILIRVILSWMPINRNGAIMSLIYALTEPILGPIRYLLEKSPIGGKGMPLDFSPIIAVLFIHIFYVVVTGLF